MIRYLKNKRLIKKIKVLYPELEYRTQNGYIKVSTDYYSEYIKDADIETLKDVCKDLLKLQNRKNNMDLLIK